MSEYSVKDLKRLIKDHEQLVKNDLRSIEKHKRNIAKLKKLGSLTKANILDEQADIKICSRGIQESKKEITKFKKMLPSAIKYEKEHPESKNDTWGERRRRLHLNTIRKKAVVMTKAKALANKIEKLTGIRAYAYPDYSECKACINISASVVNLNKAKKLVDELADAKVSGIHRIPLSGRRNRFVMRGNIHVEVV